MRRPGASIALLLLAITSVATACRGASPAAPTRTLVAIELSQTALVVPRNETVSLQAMGSFSDGSREDVTAQASWRLSDTGVAQLAGPGKISGVAPGQTVVRADYSGYSATSPVTVRRRTALSGVVSVSTTPGWLIIDGLEAYLDGSRVGRVGFQSDHAGGYLWSLTFSNAGVIPGDHDFRVDVVRFWGTGESERPIGTPTPPTLTLSDADTHEILKAIPLSAQTNVLRGGSTPLNWSVAVPLLDR